MCAHNIRRLLGGALLFGSNIQNATTTNNRLQQVVALTAAPAHPERAHQQQSSLLYWRACIVTVGYLVYCNRLLFDRIYDKNSTPGPQLKCLTAIPTTIISTTLSIVDCTDASTTRCPTNSSTSHVFCHINRMNDDVVKTVYGTKLSVLR